MAAPAPRPSAPAERLRLRVRGLVQGVGFRPFVHGLAARHGLAGFVGNDPEGVLIEVEGAGVAAFLDELPREKPAPARIDALEVERLPAAGLTAFTIRPSQSAGQLATAIGPDLALCPDCLSELFDPADRRWRYPFLTCARCGPRYTITRGLPYDRPQTSLADFPLCPACAREYHDPADRRFHAEPLACPVCGPRLDEPIEAVLARLSAGQIVALKGLGGFHLLCDARDPAAVARLRARKGRLAKPLAVMVASLAAARRVARIDPAEAALLEAPDRPIVLVPALPGSGVAPGVADGLPSLGLMLAYTPLHLLLFHEAAGRPAGTAWLEHDPPDLVLVATSANRWGEPILTDDGEARAALAGIADAVVGHDRPIVARADDSVVKLVAGRPTFLRRARGQVPLPVRLPRAVAPVLAVGAQLKATVCLTRGAEAFLSTHVGDLEDAATLAFLEEAIGRMRALLEVSPVAVAHDLHPDLPSTRLARALGLPAIAVQHHHAHIAATLAEHGRLAPALGLALDGVGFGPDGTVWGGELLRVDGAQATRLGHLRHLRQPGGDAAAREPWRMAVAALHAMGRGGEAPALFPDRVVGPLLALLDRGIACPPTSSCGRLLDAAAALLGLCPVQRYEAEAAMRLEALVRIPRVLKGGFALHPDGSLDLLPLLAALPSCDPVLGAELVHGTLARGLAAWVAAAARRTGVRVVALGGGCLVNDPLVDALVADLAAAGLEPLRPQAVPPGDGGLALGQAWVAALRLEGG